LGIFVEKLSKIVFNFNLSKHKVHSLFLVQFSNLSTHWAIGT